MSVIPNSNNTDISTTSNGFYPPTSSPPMGAAGRMVNPHQGLDIWGPLQRRKYMVVVFCLIGAGLGYLYYSKTPVVYASRTQLMITTQAPPAMGDGNFMPDKVSLPKHLSLVASELVLSSAAKNGRFDKMETFRDEPFPVAVLQKGMLTIIPGEEETFEITCRGPSAEDLPAILNQIVASYRAIIVEDSQTMGQQTVDLVQSLASELSEVKAGAERKRIELLRKLGVQSVDNKGYVVNPYTKRLYGLMDEQAKLQKSLRETQERAKLLSSSLKVDEETGTIDEIPIKVAALDAQKYLKLTRKVLTGLDREVRQYSNLEAREWSLEAKISDLTIERGRMSDVFGAGYKAISTIDSQLEYFGQQMNDIREEKHELDKFIVKQSEITGVGAGEVNTPADVDLFRAQEDREWITMYQLALEQEQQSLVANLKALNEEIEKVAKASELVSEGVVELNLLKGEVEEKRRAVGVSLDRLSEMNIVANSYTMTKIRVLDEPKYGAKIAPSLLKSLGLGIMLSFLAGLGLAILIDQSELSFRSPHEIFERLQVPVVGRVPRINTRVIKPEIGHAAIVAAHKPASTAAESFRDIRTGLFFRSSAEDIKTILFTSPSPGDGKSTVVGNMAVSIARAGKRVILVDADFRRPRIHQYFGEELSPGLLDVLAGEMSLKEAIQKTQIQENMYLLTSGGRPKNPGELVASEAFRDLIGALREKFDYVLIDSPPVLPVSDPATIASIADGVYLVSRIRKGIKLTAQKAKETLDRVDATWMGIIVNGIDENPHYSEYGYQYGNFSYHGGAYGRYYDARNKVYRDKIVDASDKSDQSVESV